MTLLCDRIDSKQSSKFVSLYDTKLFFFSYRYYMIWITSIPYSKARSFLDLYKQLSDLVEGFFKEFCSWAYNEPYHSLWNIPEIEIHIFEWVRLFLKPCPFISLVLSRPSKDKNCNVFYTRALPTCRDRGGRLKLGRRQNELEEINFRRGLGNGCGPGASFLGSSSREALQ